VLCLSLGTGTKREPGTNRIWVQLAPSSFNEWPTMAWSIAPGMRGVCEKRTCDPSEGVALQIDCIIATPDVAAGVRDPRIQTAANGLRSRSDRLLVHARRADLIGLRGNCGDLDGVARPGRHPARLDHRERWSRPLDLRRQDRVRHQRVSPPARRQRPSVVRSSSNHGRGVTIVTHMIFGTYTAKFALAGHGCSGRQAGRRGGRGVGGLRGRLMRGGLVSAVACLAVASLAAPASATDIWISDHRLHQRRPDRQLDDRERARRTSR